MAFGASFASPCRLDADWAPACRLRVDVDGARVRTRIGSRTLKGRTILRPVSDIIKWASIPALLIGSLFSFYAAGYGLAIDLIICVAAIVKVQRVVRCKEYLWVAALVTVVVVFSPVGAVIKIFLSMGLNCMATLVTLVTGFRTRTDPVL